ncbi:MAG: histidinol-phosphatase HisJ family protein [Oscillospiraceae bacterium]
MQYIDHHLHSNCSQDGSNTMLEMARVSYEAGVSRLCFTDHCDLDSFSTGVPDENCFSFRDKMGDMFSEAVLGAPRGMTLGLGLELGEINHNPRLAAQIAASPELDFILGSLHNLRGNIDFYEMDYPDETFCSRIIDDYVEELVELSRLDSFDTMAHIGYPIRYTRRSGFKTELNLKTHGDALRLMLKNLIEGGRGIEINCAGFRNPLLGDSIPTADILRLYRELGGEIITVGSDAHKVADAGGGIKRGFDILRDLGYKYVTAFAGRKPEFIKI